MSQHTDIDYIISRYLTGRASESEKEELEQWLSTSSANREMFERLKELWSVSYSNEAPDNLAQVRDRIWIAGTGSQQRLKPPVGQTINLFHWSKVAAVLFILFGGVWLFNQLAKVNSTELGSIAWVVKSNPEGQKSRHILSDGTRVWLNAGSSLKYVENFTDTLRLVELTGEAFFEVAKDRQKPFIVKAGGIQTEALGTAFNIRAYDDESKINVALLEGKVRIQNNIRSQLALLSPGEELYASKNNTNFSKLKFNYENTFGWKDGILIFDGVDFTTFCRTIERWYGVKVEVMGKAPNDWELRARYQREDLTHILRDISFNKNLNFEIQDKKVHIILK